MIAPHLKGKMRDVMTADISKALNALGASKSTVARTTLRNARNYLSGAFRYVTLSIAARMSARTLFAKQASARSTV
jgi:hypothetical protein